MRDVRVRKLLSPFPGRRLLACGFLQQGLGIFSCVDRGFPAPALEPALELHSVELRMELDAEMPPDRERLDPHVVGREEVRRRGQDTAVPVELERVRRSRSDYAASGMMPPW